MNTFTCNKCQTTFYSFSSEKTAKCSNCGSECSELGNTTASQKVDFDSLVDKLRRRGGGCNSGGGCCG